MTYLDRAELSPAQLAVLSDPTARGLVAAGAGSGKTRLLVAYFVRALLDEQVPLGELAAVTFTRKAGSELAERIRRELARCGRPDLARGIDRATIGTIHGLCSRLLREHPLEAAVDPSFSILEDDMASLVREEVSKQAWDRVIGEVTDAELAAIASRGDRLREQAVELYERLRGMGRAEPRVQIPAGTSEQEAGFVLAEACTEAAAGIRAHCKCGASLDEDLVKIGRCLEWLERRAAGLEQPAVVATNGFFPSRRTKAAEPWLSPVREALIRYRCALAEEELRPVAAVLNQLLVRFHEDYVAYKETHGVLDFADLELRAGAMLRGNAGAHREPVGSPTGLPATRRSGEPGFASRLLIDEFQDTNEVQCAILDALGAARVLMVGDERQSIYRFRGADVDVFRRRKESGDVGQHRLDTNYRSRPEILTFVNRLFSSQGFFGSGTFALLHAGRDLDQDPPAGRETDCGDARPAWATEVLVTDRPAAGEGQEDVPGFHEAEARAVAARVRRLIDEEGFSQGDIVVLLPVLSNVGLYQDALLAQGLDVYVVRGKGYYSQEEVEDVTALLRLLINPHDDLALLTVLRSPLVGVSDDCLYLVGRMARRSGAESLWQVVREGRVGGLSEADDARLRAFLERLERLRNQVGRPGLSQLIDKALTACDYDLCLLGSPEGKRRFANIRKLMRMATDFEALEGPDLAGFVRLIGSLNRLGDSEGNAPSLAEDEDVVRIMTVHQAKGLEFPAVFLSGLGSPGRNEAPGEFVVGHDGRIAGIVKERQERYEGCHPYWGPAAEILAEEKRREEEEDIRLLYVAMTRARDRLFLVGARPKGDRLGQVPIGRIVEALGLEELPISGVSVPLEALQTAVIAIPYTPDGLGEENASETVCGSSQAPAPACFLNLALPSDVPRQVSFSALSAFQRCPRQFYLARVLGVGHPSDVLSGERGEDTRRPEAVLDEVEGQSGRDVGLLVHALLESADLTADRPEVESLRRLAEGLAETRGLALAGSDVGRAAELAGAFWESSAAADPRLATALREEPFFFVHGRTIVHGVIDLLLQGEKEWRIVDYKSNALNGRTPNDIAETYTLQADMYCLAALKAGAPTVRLEFLFLEDPTSPVAFAYAAEERQRLESRLEQALAGLEEGAFPARPGPACPGCGVEDVCMAMDGLWSVGDEGG